jgi:hypothetical protein
MFKLGIQKNDNVVIKGWCSCCSEGEEECSPRFFVLGCSNTGDQPWTKISCYSSGDSDYEVGNLYYKYSYELRRI